MKHISLSLIFLCLFTFSNASAQKTKSSKKDKTEEVVKYLDIAPGLSKKKHRSKIDEVMDELINRVHLETDCKKNEITYSIIQKGSCYKKKSKKNLPKTIIINACGQKLTFIRSGMQSLDLNRWHSFCSWILNSTSK